MPRELFVHRAIAIALVLKLTNLCAADEWPQWRGAGRDGLWHESGIVDSFTADSLHRVWQQPIGSGYSSPVVAGGRVLVMDRQMKPQQSERVLCFDATSGQPQWTITYEARYEGVGYIAGPRASVTVDGDRAYALGTMGHLHCINVADGSIHWKRDLNRDYSIGTSDRMPIWGIAASPLVYGDLVILHIGGADGACLVALDKVTSEERWRALDDRGQYSSPVIAQHEGRDVLICWTGDSVAGLDPATGEVHWRHEFRPSRMPIGIATPLIEDDHIFVTSFYDGSLMLRMLPDEKGVEKVWQAAGPNERDTRALHSIISTPLWIGDHLYGVDSFGQLRCLRASDGERVWEDLSAVPEARWSTIHFVRNGDAIWMFNERGELILGSLSPDGFDETSRARIIDPTEEQLRQRGGVCWSHPAFANRCVFVRNDRELVCVSLAERDAEESSVDEAARAVLDRYIESLGGIDALRAITGSVRRGALDDGHGGMRGTVAMWQAGERFLSEIEMEGFGTIRRGSDGETTWSIHPNDGARFVSDEAGADLRGRNGLVDPAITWIVKGEPYSGSISLEGEVEREGVACLQLVFRPLNGFESTRYFDRESGRLIALETSMHAAERGSVDVEIAFSDFRESDGITFPMRHDYRLRDGHSYGIQFDEIDLNPAGGIPEERFALPPEIQSLGGASGGNPGE